MPERTFALFGTRRSLLKGAAKWTHMALTPDEMDELATDLADRVGADDPSTASLVIVVESVGDLLNGPADMPLQDLIKACRAMDRFVVVEGETSSVGSSWPLLQAAKAGRYGIAMQPEQLDGDSLLPVHPAMERTGNEDARGYRWRAAVSAPATMIAP